MPAIVCCLLAFVKGRWSQRSSSQTDGGSGWGTQDDGRYEIEPVPSARPFFATPHDGLLLAPPDRLEGTAPGRDDLLWYSAASWIVSPSPAVSRHAAARRPNVTRVGIGLPR